MAHSKESSLDIDSDSSWEKAALSVLTEQEKVNYDAECEALWDDIMSKQGPANSNISNSRTSKGLASDDANILDPELAWPFSKKVKFWFTITDGDNLVVEVKNPRQNRNVLVGTVLMTFASGTGRYTIDLRDVREEKPIHLELSDIHRMKKANSRWEDFNPESQVADTADFKLELSEDEGTSESQGSKQTKYMLENLPRLADGAFDLITLKAQFYEDTRRGPQASESTFEDYLDLRCVPELQRRFGVTMKPHFVWRTIREVTPRSAPVIMDEYLKSYPRHKKAFHDWWITDGAQLCKYLDPNILRVVQTTLRARKNRAANDAEQFIDGFDDPVKSLLSGKLWAWKLEYAKDHMDPFKAWIQKDLPVMTVIRKYFGDRWTEHEEDAQVWSWPEDEIDFVDAGQAEGNQSSETDRLDVKDILLYAQPMPFEHAYVRWEKNGRRAVASSGDPIIPEFQIFPADFLPGGRFEYFFIPRYEYVPPMLLQELLGKRKLRGIQKRVLWQRLAQARSEAIQLAETWKIHKFADRDECPWLELVKRHKGGFVNTLDEIQFRAASKIKNGFIRLDLETATDAYDLFVRPLERLFGFDMGLGTRPIKSVTDDGKRERLVDLILSFIGKDLPVLRNSKYLVNELSRIRLLPGETLVPSAIEKVHPISREPCLLVDDGLDGNLSEMETEREPEPVQGPEPIDVVGATLSRTLDKLIKEVEQHKRSKTDSKAIQAKTVRINEILAEIKTIAIKRKALDMMPPGAEAPGPSRTTCSARKSKKGGSSTSSVTSAASVKGFVTTKARAVKRPKPVVVTETKQTRNEEVYSGSETDNSGRTSWKHESRAMSEREMELTTQELKRVGQQVVKHKLNRGNTLERARVALATLKQVVTAKKLDKGWDHDLLCDCLTCGIIKGRSAEAHEAHEAEFEKALQRTMVKGQRDFQQQLDLQAKPPCKEELDFFALNKQLGQLKTSQMANKIQKPETERVNTEPVTQETRQLETEPHLEHAKHVQGSRPSKSNPGTMQMDPVTKACKDRLKDPVTRACKNRMAEQQLCNLDESGCSPTTDGAKKRVCQCSAKVTIDGDKLFAYASETLHTVKGVKCFEIPAYGDEQKWKKMTLGQSEALNKFADSLMATKVHPYDRRDLEQVKAEEKEQLLWLVKAMDKCHFRPEYTKTDYQKPLAAAGRDPKSHWIPEEPVVQAMPSSIREPEKERVDLTCAGDSSPERGQSPGAVFTQRQPPEVNDFNWDGNLLSPPKWATMEMSAADVARHPHNRISPSQCHRIEVKKLLRRFPADCLNAYNDVTIASSEEGHFITVRVNTSVRPRTQYGTQHGDGTAVVNIPFRNMRDALFLLENLIRQKLPPAVEDQSLIWEGNNAICESYQESGSFTYRCRVIAVEKQLGIDRIVQMTQFMKQEPGQPMSNEGETITFPWRHAFLFHIKLENVWQERLGFEPWQVRSTEPNAPAPR